MRTGRRSRRGGERASADCADYLATQQRMWQANRATNAAGRFARRAAARTARDATQTHRTTEDTVRRRWGDVPLTTNHRYDEISRELTWQTLAVDLPGWAGLLSGLFALAEDTLHNPTASPARSSAIQPSGST